ncbi:hypothetical protein NL676_030005 [Syzygium grande]|nr:hypothetical protein NL676_030005 [Syzygium grande]
MMATLTAAAVASSSVAIRPFCAHQPSLASPQIWARASGGHGRGRDPVLRCWLRRLRLRAAVTPVPEVPDWCGGSRSSLWLLCCPASRDARELREEVLFCLQVERNHRKHRDRAPDVVVAEARDRVKEFYVFEIIGIGGGASKSCRRCFTDATSSSDSLVM